jgi:solute carrier family 50 (sugar transporter)
VALGVHVAAVLFRLRNALTPHFFSLLRIVSGWVVYGYYTRDPFVVAANLPGLILSIWLNSGASKLQYLALSEARKQRLLRESDRQHWDASRPMEGDSLDDEVLLNDTERSKLDDAFVVVPQERDLLRVLSAWAAVIVYVGWFSRSNDAAAIVGFIVNINLIVFYGAPLQTMQTVISTNNSASIHVPTMVMNWLNTTFWIGYGIARHDVVIILPNVLGLCLGLTQGVLKLHYPSRPHGGLERVPGEDESDSIHSSPPGDEGNVSLNRRSNTVR